MTTDLEPYAELVVYIDGAPHGTPSGYTYHRCRCEACATAQRDYARELRRRKGHVLTQEDVDAQLPWALRGDYPAQLAYRTREIPNGCWEFTGSIDAATGYGLLGKRTRSPHRLAWEIANGKTVPGHMVIDHTCHNDDPTCAGGPTCLHRRCVNPAHLDLVDRGTNVMRGKTLAATNAAKTHCIRGHEFTPDNTYTSRAGWRLCRACRRMHHLRSRAKYATGTAS